MGRPFSSEDRRRRYGYGLVSEHYIRTGQPLAEKLSVDARRDEEIRAEILADDIWQNIRKSERPKKKGKRRRDKSDRQVIFV